MAYEIVFKKRFSSKLLNVLEYLEREWNAKVASAFLDIIDRRIDSLKSHPHIGALTSIRDVRSIHVTKHNRIYYKVVDKKVILLNLYDTRKKKD